MKRKRPRYVPPENATAKAEADYWGRTYIAARINCGRLKSTVVLVEIGSKVFRWDPAEKLRSLEQQITESRAKVAEAFEKLGVAREALAKEKDA